MTAPAQPADSLKTDIVVYLCILALSGVQVLLAYQDAEGAQLRVRMLAVALIQAGLAVMFLMHLDAEQRNLKLALIPGSISVVRTMTMIWCDSIRLLHMSPFAQ